MTAPPAPPTHPPLPPSRPPTAAEEAARRREAWQARVLALGQMQVYLLRRLGAPEALVGEWMGAWKAGDMTRLIGVQNDIIARLPPGPRRGR